LDSPRGRRPAGARPSTPPKGPSGRRDRAAGTAVAGRGAMAHTRSAGLAWSELDNERRGAGSGRAREGQAWGRKPAWRRPEPTGRRTCHAVRSAGPACGSFVAVTSAPRVRRSCHAVTSSEKQQPAQGRSAASKNRNNGARTSPCDGAAEVTRATEQRVIVHTPCRATAIQQAKYGADRGDYAYHVKVTGWCDIGYNPDGRPVRRNLGRPLRRHRRAVVVSTPRVNTCTSGLCIHRTPTHYARLQHARSRSSRGIAVLRRDQLDFRPGVRRSLTSGGLTAGTPPARSALVRVMGSPVTPAGTDETAQYLYGTTYLPRIRGRPPTTPSTRRAFHERVGRGNPVRRHREP